MKTDFPARHSWAWLRPQWRDHLLVQIQGEGLPYASLWIAAGLPLIVTSRHPGDGRDDVRLGLATPDKKRIPLHLHRKAISRFMPPVPLAEALPSAPLEWRHGLESLQHDLAKFNCHAAVYGSLAWQHMSGKSYIHARSDLDLLLTCSAPAQVADMLDYLDQFAQSQIPALDGEILLSNGDAVAWRELARSRGAVLVKSHNGVHMRARADILGLAG